MSLPVWYKSKANHSALWPSSMFEPSLHIYCVTQHFGMCWNATVETSCFGNASDWLAYLQLCQKWNIVNIGRRRRTAGYSLDDMNNIGLMSFFFFFFLMPQLFRSECLGKQIRFGLIRAAQWPAITVTDRFEVFNFLNNKVVNGWGFNLYIHGSLQGSGTDLAWISQRVDYEF